MWWKADKPSWFLYISFQHKENGFCFFFWWQYIRDNKIKISRFKVEQRRNAQSVTHSNELWLLRIHRSYERKGNDKLKKKEDDKKTITELSEQFITLVTFELASVQYRRSLKFNRQTNSRNWDENPTRRHWFICRVCICCLWDVVPKRPSIKPLRSHLDHMAETTTAGLVRHWLSNLESDDF